MTRSIPSSSARGRTQFSRATDSGTSSTIFGCYYNTIQVHVVQAVLFGHRPADILAGRVSQPQDGIVQFHARVAGHLVGFQNLVRSHNPVADENVGVCQLSV